MDHTPFIVAAYGLSALVFAWIALAPVLQTRRFQRQWLLSLRRRDAAGPGDRARPS